jgi:Zn-dependent peptidase ImmA (M78 family)
MTNPTNRSKPMTDAHRDMCEQANVFAAYLLLPEGIFEEAVERANLDPACDVQMAAFAKKMKVPIHLISYRLQLMKEQETDDDH